MLLAHVLKSQGMEMKCPVPGQKSMRDFYLHPEALQRPPLSDHTEQTALSCQTWCTVRVAQSLGSCSEGLRPTWLLLLFSRSVFPPIQRHPDRGRTGDLKDTFAHSQCSLLFHSQPSLIPPFEIPTP